jgi:hypothetical protein
MTNEPAGTHTSRTMMLDELEALLAGCPPDASYEAYAAAIVDDNLLRKGTLATRRKTLRHLRELYALRSGVPVFTALRALWTEGASARPLLALMCATARDPLLRCTAEVVVDAPVQGAVEVEAFRRAVDAAFPGRFTSDVLARISRNVASSWTQSGHLSGRGHKIRQAVQPTPASTAYALYLGHLGGDSGSALFRTTWAAVLDGTEGELRIKAAAASRSGWIHFRSAAGMTDVTFRYLADLAGTREEVSA